MIEPSKLHAYVDGELTGAELQEVEAKLAECAESRAEVASIQSLKTMLNQAPGMECQDVWANCQSRLDAIDRVRKSGNFITKFSWAFVAGVALVLVIGGGISRHAEGRTVDNSALAGFISNPTNQTAEKKSQNAELDQILQRANEQLNRIHFIRGARIVQNDQTAERLDFEDAKGPFSLLVLPERSNFDDMSADDSGKYYFGKIDVSTHAVGWRTQNACLVLIGRREFEDLRELAQRNFILPQ